jgi:hypothetical protein
MALEFLAEIRIGFQLHLHFLILEFERHSLFEVLISIMVKHYAASWEGRGFEF